MNTTLQQWETRLREQEIAICSNCRVRLEYDPWQTYKYLGLLQYYNEIIAILNHEGGSGTELTFAFPSQLEAVPKVAQFVDKIVRVTWNPTCTNIHNVQAGWFGVHRDGHYQLKAQIGENTTYIPYISSTGIIQFSMELL